MGKKYTTDEIHIGGHELDAAMMVNLNTVVSDHASYLTSLPSHIHTWANINGETANSVNAWGGLRHQTNNGYIDFGPANSGHAHVYTDRPSFYFNKSLIVNNGSIVNQNDVRAGVFYDINNTGYYLNPASTSLLNIVKAPVYNVASGNDNGIGFWADQTNYTIKMGNNQQDHGTVTDYSMHFNMGPSAGRGFTFGSSRTAVSASINALTGAANFSGAVTWSGGSSANANTAYTHSQAAHAPTNAEANVYSSASELLTAIKTVDGSGSGLDADKLDGYNSAQNGSNVILRTASNNYLYINSWIHPANGTGLFYDAGVHFHETGNYMYSNTSLQAANDMRAPSFYDRDNTGYYLNPASTSNLNTVAIAGTTTLSGRLNLDLTTDYDSTVVTGLTQAPMQIADVNIGSTDAYLPLAHMSARYTSGYRTHMNIGLKKTASAWGDSTTGMYVALGGNDGYPTRNWLFSYGGYIRSGVDGVYATDSFRAPIFYDSNNTGYYLDPAGTSVLNRLEVDGDIDMRAQVGLWITSNVMSDAIGWNTNYGVYIGSNVGGTHYLRGNGTFTTGGSTYNLWHAGNDGSGSGLDADTVDGHHASTTRNSANTIPIRDANGYINLGWINTTSGNTTSTITDIYVNTNDGYIRKATPAHFRSQITDGNYLPIGGKAADSNLLDGINSTSFLRSDANDSFSGTLSGSAQIMIEPNDYGKGVYGKYNSSKFQHVWGMGSSWHLNSSGSSLGNFYGIAYTHTNVGAGSQSGFSHQTLFVENGVPRTWIGQGVRTVGDLISDASVKAPIFYDSNDTNYYGNFASNSRYHTAQGNYLGLGISANTSGSYRLNMGGNIDMNNNGIDYTSQLHFNNNVRFYQDSNDSYLNFKYGDANYGGIRFRRGDSAQKGYLYADNAGFGFLDSDGHWAVQTRTGTDPLTLFCDNNPEFYVYNSYTYSPGSSRAPIFYDSNDTGYYLNPASTSNLNGLTVNGTLTASLPYSSLTGAPTIPTDHGDHDGLYLPIGGGTVTGDLTVNGKITQAGVVDREEWGRTYAASNTTIATLVTSDGSALPTGGAYRMTGHISGTGTEQVSVAVFWNENGTWYCNNTFAGGTSSNHIEFLISGAVPKIKTWHANNYNINVTHERLSLDEGTGTDNLRGYFGADSFLKWTESTNALVVPGTISATGYNDTNWNTAYTHSQATHAPTNAEANVQSDWNATSGDALILNKPTIPTDFVSAAYGGTFNGNVGIGTTSPGQKLEVEGNIRLSKSNDVGSGFEVGRDNSTLNAFIIQRENADLFFRTNDSERMRILANGNVGIGTSSPSFKLYVAGSAYANGLTIGSSNLLLQDTVSTYSTELRMQNNAHTLGIDYQNNETLRFITRSGATTVPITFQMRAGTITAANFILSSDERKKTKIADLTCDNVDVSWKSFEMKDNEGEYRTGVIAQELEQKHPEFVNTDDEGYKTVKYIDLLIAKIAELEARLEKVESNGCKKCK